MARIASQNWKAVLTVAMVTLVVALTLGGYLFWAVGIAVLLLALAGGALLFRTFGPPSR